MPSSSTRDLLPPSYVTKERGKIQVKGKGEMTTFWVESKANRAPPSKDDVRSLILKHYKCRNNRSHEL